MQRKKRGEQGVMKMGGADWKETEIQVKAAKNKTDKERGWIKACFEKTEGTGWIESRGGDGYEWCQNICFLIFG